MTNTLSQLDGRIFLSEAGLETDLIFNHGVELPLFASFPLLDSEAGRGLITDYYESFVQIARRDGTGVVFETPTWRASSDWGDRLGYDADSLDRVNRAAIELLRDLAAANPDVTMLISGNLGPRGDGYVAGTRMTPNDAARYHAPQIRSLAAGGADLISAFTLNYSDEAVGVVTAAVEQDMPVAISFTVETDGRLPSGEDLAEAIDTVDRLTDAAAAHFMVNCAHPTHFRHVLESPGPWHRVRGYRANASTASHAELDDATELDRGDAHDLANHYVAMRELLPNLAVVGGCCGTDLAHVDAISSALAAVGTGR